MGSIFWFLLVRKVLNDWAAALCAMWLPLLPDVLLFEKTVMLEIPLLACCLGASYCWIYYLLETKKSHLYCFALFASGELLTQQNGVYLIVSCAFSVLPCVVWKMIL